MILPNGIIEDCYAEGARGNAINISFDHHNVPVFCASIGLYDYDRHLKIINGFGEYPANPEMTAFVIMDARKFGGLMCAISEMIFKKRCDVFERNVIYQAREKLVGEFDAQNHMGREGQTRFYKRLPFTKPTIFSIEEEVRFITPLNKNVIQKVEPIFSINLQKEIQIALASCIIDSGSERPRLP